MSFSLPLLLSPLRSRPLPYLLGLGLSTSAVALTFSLSPLSPFQLYSSRPLLLESSSSSSSSSTTPSEVFRTYSAEAKTPIFTENGRPNPRAFRQVSLGSLLGLAAGLSVSLFSKTLAFLIGAAIFGIQWFESRGIHIIPRQRLQRYFSSINLRSALEDDVAFKLCFGATFMLAAFGELK